LPEKLSRPFGAASLLEHVVRRVSSSKCLDQVVVATSDLPRDRRIVELVPLGVPVFFGSEDDVLNRFAQALKAYPAASVVRICADNPFIDVELLDALVQHAWAGQDYDYLSYGFRGGRPVIQSAAGLFAEWCSSAALCQADEEAADPADREHVTRYLYSRPEQFRIGLLEAPAELDRDDLRLAVDVEDDLEHARSILAALGDDKLNWRTIAGFLDRQPELRLRMRELNRANPKIWNRETAHIGKSVTHSGTPQRALPTNCEPTSGAAQPSLAQ
jgi:spore coat polysaccharide biosynthesis protein SpsF